MPPTHTVFADVRAPFTHESVCASTGASIVSMQPQSTTVTAHSQSAMHAQLVPNSAVNFNALPIGITATADTVVPPPMAMPPPMPPITVHNNNNNKHDNVYGAVIMAEPLREFTRFI